MLLLNLSKVEETGEVIDHSVWRGASSQMWSKRKLLVHRLRTGAADNTFVITRCLIIILGITHTIQGTHVYGTCL